MCGLKALRVALDLRHVPSRVRHARAAPLPEGVPLLLRIAAGDPAAEREALELVDRSLAEIREAAGFFIEQILLAPDSNSYRVLGATPEATTAELRRNMALLMRWLHPDTDPAGDRQIFAGRVTSAWDDIKTAERRAAYDRRVSTTGSSGTNAPPPLKRKSGKRRRSGALELAPSYAGARPLVPYRHKSTSLFGRLLSFLSGKRLH